jgi:hypothetical protein
MTCVSRRPWVPIVGGIALALASALSACSSNSASGSVGTSGQQDAFVAVNVSAPIVTVENRTAQPLVDVNLAIKSGILLFTDRVSRLEANEKRQLRLSDFTSRDGTSFNLQVARPTQINVTAADLAGKQFDTTLPWSN